MDKPLEGLTVLEFCQYLAGPSAGLRLADLGARVIKIERPRSGEACRQLSIKNLFVDGDSLLFHTINRNKESYAANLKDPEDLARVRQLIAQADVVTHNFRPGVMAKIGLDYEQVRPLNPRLVYATVSGYGTEGPWATKPGQDLLLQSLSGLAALTGTADADPTPMGLAVADMLCGAHLVQGILAALIARGATGEGSLVEVSLLESILDFQFEVLTTHLNDGGQAPQRAARYGAHAYLSAPYGIYPTLDGYLALAMGNVPQLADCLDCPELAAFQDSSDWFDRRDEILEIIAAALARRSADEWLRILEPLDVWCAKLFGYNEIVGHDAFKALQMRQSVQRDGAPPVETLRCPIRIDGHKLYATRPAPRVGADNVMIEKEFIHA